MRLMHISDLHLGKIVHDVNMIDDQKEALDKVCEMIAYNNVDLLIVAGDIYDKTTPSAEAMNLFNEFLLKLSSININTLIISGNHDSSVRLDYLSSFLKKKNIFISKPFDGSLEKYSFKDEFGDINFYLLPFFKLSQAKSYLNINFNNYDEAITKMIENKNIDFNQRNVLVAHQFVVGASTCDSEEISIGGLDGLSYESLIDFDYVALGHLHGPQKIGKEHIRYSGTLLKYSFSEVNHKKSICLIDMLEKGNININLEKFNVSKDMKEYRGSYDYLYNLKYTEDYVRVVLTDEEVYPDSRINLLSVFPNMMRFAIENSKTNYDMSIKDLENFEKMSPIALFTDFYSMQNNNKQPSEKQLQVIQALISGEEI